MTANYQIVFITAPTVDEAQTIARALVEESLAACVNIIEGCRSIYRWEGDIHTDQEVLLLVKTERRRFPEVEKRVSDLHSYDVPEIVALDLAALSAGYRRFLEDVLGE